MSEPCARCGFQLQEDMRRCPLCGAIRAGKPFRVTLWQVIWVVIGLEFLGIVWLAMRQ